MLSKPRCLYATMAALFLLTMEFDQGDGLPDVIRIGGLFDDTEDPIVESAFRYAIFRINQDQSLLPNTKLVYDIQHLPAHNSFIAAKRVCNQASLGVAAIFGPQSAGLAGYINSMCNTLEVPHIETRLESRVDGHEQQVFSINVHPQTTQLSRVYLDLIRLFRWTKLCVIYGDHSDLLLLQSLIRAPLNADIEILVRQASRNTMRETLKEIDKRDFTNIMIHLNTDDTYHLLKAALQVGMIDVRHQYIVTNLDFETLDLEDFRHNYANITGLRIVNRDDKKTKDILEQMHLYQRHTGIKLLNNTSQLLVKIDAALIYDAVYVFAHALEQVEPSYSRMRLVNLSCDGEQAWAFGSSLYSYLNLVEMDGLTGQHAFESGRRHTLQVDVMQLRSNGLSKVGRWNGGINLTQSLDFIQHGTVFANKTLRITTILEKPYVMEKTKEEGLSGNDRYEGFCVDLLKDIADEVDFRYTFMLVPDGKYGAPERDAEDGEKESWTGMVRELMDNKADLAVASLTINYLREKVVDFTKPFMNLGISILFKRPRRESPGLFSFLNPLAIEIWVYVIAAYLVVSFMMYVLARFSPYEWYNPHPCNPDSAVLENIFTLSNAFWFAVGTLMQQGSDINPRAVSTRIVGGMWWFFTLIIISSYTANLAAFLTVERMVSPIESAEDLAKQTKIAYGTIQGGSTWTFFRESKLPTYQRMWAFMDNQEKSVFVKTSEEGIERVLKGDYAFLMESTMIDYNVQRNCELMQVGGLLDSKGYGIGTRIGSEYRDRISMKILSMQESGRIQVLYNKWWKNTGICVNDDKKKDNKASSLGVANVGGIFVVLFIGLALAVVVAALEFVWNSRKHSNFNRLNNQNSVWSDMMEELRFAIRCHGSTKKPRLRRRCSQCSAAHPSTGTLPPTASAIDYNSSSVLATAATLNLDRSSPNGSLVPHSMLTEDLLHRRRANQSRDLRDVTNDGYYSTTTNNSHYSTKTLNNDVTPGNDTAHDYHHRDASNERLRHLTADNYSGKL